MVYLKAFVVGVVGAILAVILWLLVILLSQLPWSPRESGVGAVSIAFPDTLALLVALAGFVVGFAWTVRRGRRQRRMTSSNDR